MQTIYNIPKLQLINQVPQNCCVIVADGEFPSNPNLLNLLIEAPVILCCDGAIKHLNLHHITPSFIIGDCDSISPEDRTKFGDKLITIADQSTNDLTKAANFAKELNFKKIIILGATGLREDHSLANISLLASYINWFDQVLMISDYGIFSAHLAGKFSLETEIKQQVSIFSLDPTTTISCNELKWPLENHKFELLHHGSLNEATSTCANFVTNGTTIIYRSFG